MPFEPTERTFTVEELDFLRNRGSEVIVRADRQRAAWRGMSREAKRRWIQGRKPARIPGARTTSQPRSRGRRVARRARAPGRSTDADPPPSSQAELARHWARVWRAVVLAPTVEVCDALLRGEAIPRDKLDAKWFARLGVRR